jgi:hypothetical protein
MDLSFEASLRDVHAGWGWVKLGYRQLRAKDPASWIHFSFSLMFGGIVWAIIFGLLVNAGILMWAINNHTDFGTAFALANENIVLQVFLSVVLIGVWILSSLGIYAKIMHDAAKVRHPDDN